MKLKFRKKSKTTDEEFKVASFSPDYELINSDAVGDDFQALLNWSVKLNFPQDW